MDEQNKNPDDIEKSKFYPFKKSHTTKMPSTKLEPVIELPVNKAEKEFFDSSESGTPKGITRFSAEYWKDLVRENKEDLK